MGEDGEDHAADADLHVPDGPDLGTLPRLQALHDQPDRPRVVAVYADGGLIRSNPSPHGGTWATCHVDEAGKRVWESSGLLLPAAWNNYQLENNQTEFFALLQGLQALPDGWSGKACSDNQNTIRRFSDPGRASFGGIPQPWILSLHEQIERLGAIEYVLMSGHPSKQVLVYQARLDHQFGPFVKGAGKGGRPVSKHNRWCDMECTRIGTAEWQRLQTVLREATAS